MTFGSDDLLNRLNRTDLSCLDLFDFDLAFVKSICIGDRIRLLRRLNRIGFKRIDIDGEFIDLA